MDAVGQSAGATEADVPEWWSSTVRLMATVLSASRQLLVLTYHRVLPQVDPLLVDEVDDARFAREMRFLAQHLRPLPLIEAMERLARGSLPARAISVTLDDGYANNCEVALPILRREGVPATCFVATGFLNGLPMWNDRVIEALRRTTHQQLDLRAEGLGHYELGTLAGRRRAIDELLVAIKHRSPLERAAHVDRIVDVTGTQTMPGQMMDARQVRQMHEAGIEIGAHTVTHPILARIDALQARREIEESRERLGEIIGAPVRAFAYPNGRPGSDYGAEHVQMVRRAGFKLAVSTAWGAVRRGSDAFQIPRIAPWDRSVARFGARLLRVYWQPAAARV
jgi:peptidoglycan/xylan/chitin deacetylase (PgdA/CDA1 family)